VVTGDNFGAESDRKLLLELNRVTYAGVRIILMLVLGKERGDTIMRDNWRDRYDLPKPVLNLLPSCLRRKWALYYWLRRQEKGWEPKVMDYLVSVRGHLFVDVGANFGLYCTKLQRNFERMIAIEADPMIYQLLRGTRPVNCEAINIVASDSERVVSFYAPDDSTANLGGGSMFPPGEREWNPDKRADRELRLLAAPLSKILAKEKDIDLIKVDVEGAEWQVLEGAEPIMSRIKRWVIELHEPDRRNELNVRMEHYGYRQSKWLDANHGVYQRSNED
jgi:FkbM family methyltransferase